MKKASGNSLTSSTLRTSSTRSESLWNQKPFCHSLQVPFCQKRQYLKLINYTKTGEYVDIKCQAACIWRYEWNVVLIDSRVCVFPRISCVSGGGVSTYGALPGSSDIASALPIRLAWGWRCPRFQPHLWWDTVSKALPPGSAPEEQRERVNYPHSPREH